MSSLHVADTQRTSGPHRPLRTASPHSVFVQTRRRPPARSRAQARFHLQHAPGPANLNKEHLDNEHLDNEHLDNEHPQQFCWSPRPPLPITHSSAIRFCDWLLNPINAKKPLAVFRPLCNGDPLASEGILPASREARRKRRQQWRPKAERMQWAMAERWALDGCLGCGLGSPQLIWGQV